MPGSSLAKVVLAVVACLFGGIVIADATVHLFYPLSTPEGCETLVVDVYGVIDPPPNLRGVCFKRGLTAWELRSLGRVGATSIVIVTHVFSSEMGVGIGVSDDLVPFYPLLHPVTTAFSLKGVADDGSIRLALSPSVWRLSAPLAGKSVVLVTCMRERIGEVVEAMLDAGAREVAVTASAVVSRSLANRLVQEVVRNPDGLCNLGYMKCYTR